MSDATFKSSRPHMPGYGICGATDGEGLLPWSWAQERLRASHNYWIATVNSAGTPHTMPVWGVWAEGVWEEGAGKQGVGKEGALLFSTAVASRKARNLQVEPRCTATTENAAEAVIVEGFATLVTSAVAVAQLQSVYAAKYGEGFPPDSAVYRVVAHTVFAFIERGGRFATTATRWRFSR